MILASVDDATQAGLIVAAILERPTCLVCLTMKVGMTQLDAVHAVERIGTNLRVVVEHGVRCRPCGSTVGPVYSLARSE